MHKKAIVHIMTKARMKSDAFTAEIDAIEDLSEKCGIKNAIFYKGEKIEYKDLINKLEKLGILLFNYSNKEDLKEQVLELDKKYKILFVSTPLELLVNVVTEIKSILGHVQSDHPDIFRDKHLQRELIQSHNPELGIKFIKGEPEALDILEIEEKVGYPFIIKPVDGVQSAGVEKITTRKQFESYIKHYHYFHDRLKSRGVDSKILIVEEFIDGKLYSVDYFVSGDGDITVSKPIKVRLGIDVDVDDYCCIARISTEKTDGEFKGMRLKSFIKSTVQATGIKNTFVHHEFKINSKGEFKTIELNGRIGGGRLEVLKRSCDVNLYEFIVNPEMKATKLKLNNIAVNIYATKRGILTGFNKKILEKISQRSTVYKIDLEEGFIGKEVGLTRDGFVKVGVIKLEDSDYKKLRKDYLYVKSKYHDLLEIEQPPEIMKKRKYVFNKVKNFLKLKDK
ncbi:ATP-grasp domain-containing protein [Candidatus Gracilibacteria bacterium 28_42_T64]|nr:ATP-grasp domain-containing protein [Candidatus Gracilibacteria bacterium 28_42_T64]